MQILASITIGAALFALQNFDIFIVIEKFGFPVAVAVVMFWYFNRQVTRKDNELLEYRQQTLESLNDQTVFLKKLLDEARTANDGICKFTHPK